MGGVRILGFLRNWVCSKLELFTLKEGISPLMILQKIQAAIVRDIGLDRMCGNIQLGMSSDDVDFIGVESDMSWIRKLSS